MTNDPPTRTADPRRWPWIVKSRSFLIRHLSFPLYPFAIFSAFAAASSIFPTYMNACSGR